MRKHKPHLAERLAQLVLGDGSLATQVVSRMGKSDWSELLDLASAWRLIPQLSFQLDAASITLDPETAARLGRLETAAAAHASMVCQFAAIALADCARLDISVAAFKGIAAIAHLYGSPARRMISDADVLLHVGQLEQAMKVFHASGFKPASDLDLQRWNRVLEERVLPFHDYIVVKNSHGVEIDVHWRIAARGGIDLCVEQLLARSVKIRLQRNRMQVVDRLDALLLTAHHTLRERFRPHVAIKDLYDQANWLRNIAPGDLTELSSRARDWGLETALLASWISIARLDGSSQAGNFLATARDNFSAESFEVAGQLADYFVLQLRTGSVSESMLGLSSMSPAMLRRFFSSRWRRLTDKSAEAREVREHVEGGNWPAFKRLLRDIATLSPGRYRMYRTMARENKRMIGDGD